MDSTIIYYWFEVLQERCNDAYLADLSICVSTIKDYNLPSFYSICLCLTCLMSEMLVLQSLWEKDLEIEDDMALGPKRERVMDKMECKTLFYILHAHNHWSLLVEYVNENRWEYYNSSLGEIQGCMTYKRFVSTYLLLSWQHDVSIVNKFQN